MRHFLVAILCCSSLLIQAQNIGIGTNSPNSAAQLDVTSSSKGLLPPRLTAIQRDAIANPPAGLMLWCTNCGVSGEMQVFNGTTWTNMIGGTASIPSSQICGFIWQSKNLDVSTYRNGDPIPKVENSAAWDALTTGAYCYYNNDSATYAAIYGKLYNWYAVTDPRGLAPEGWHVSTDAEWASFETCLGGVNVAGGPLKETGTQYWFDPNAGATNATGFTARPGGVRASSGDFAFAGVYGTWWTSTANGFDAFFRRLSYATPLLFNGSQNKREGYSVRIVKNY